MNDTLACRKQGKQALVAATIIQKSNMSKHTPGPWKTDDEFIYDDSGRSIAYVETYHSGKLPYQANARLIAAAPELLDMVERLSASLTRTNGADQRLYLDAKKLIAKIEGDE